MPFPAVVTGGSGGKGLQGVGGTDISVRRRWYEESSGEVQFNGLPGNQLIQPVENPATMLGVQNPNLVGSGWAYMKNFVFHSTAELSTHSPTAYVDFWVQGAYEIHLYGSKGWDHGSFTVTLDFGIPVTIDGHCCAPSPGGLTGGILPQQILWKGTDLDPYSQHYVRITNGAPGPYGNTFAFDAFLVFQDPPNSGFTSNTQPVSTYMTPSSGVPIPTHFPAGGSEYTNSKGEVKAPVAAAPSKSSKSAAENIPRGAKRLSWASRLMFGLALGTAVQFLL